MLWTPEQPDKPIPPAGIWAPDRRLILPGQRGYEELKAGSISRRPQGPKRVYPNRVLDDGGGGAPSSPVAGYVFWLKADAGTFQTSGGSAASADGDPVGEWQDQSGNARHVSQATSGERPVLKTGGNGLNSKPVIRFDGSDDTLLSGTWQLAHPGHFFIVARKHTAEVPFSRCITWENGAAFAYGGGFAALGEFIHSKSGGNPMVISGSEGTTWGIWEALLKANDYLFARNDGTPVTDVASGASGNIADNSGTAVVLGGDGDPPSFPGNLEIAEFIVYDAKQTGGDVDLILSYLNGKWAVY